MENNFLFLSGYRLTTTPIPKPPKPYFVKINKSPGYTHHWHFLLKLRDKILFFCFVLFWLLILGLSTQPTLYSWSSHLMGRTAHLTTQEHCVWCVFLWVWISARMWRSKSGNLSLFPFLRQGLPLDLSLIDLTAWVTASETHLSIWPQHWSYRGTMLCPASMWVLGIRTRVFRLALQAFYQVIQFPNP